MTSVDLRMRCMPNSFLVDAGRCAAFIANPDQEQLDKDLGIIVGNSAIQTYFAGMSNPAEDKFNRGYRLFVKGLREMDAGQAIAPDANSTMRLTYRRCGPIQGCGRGDITTSSPRPMASWKKRTTPTLNSSCRTRWMN